MLRYLAVKDEHAASFTEDGEQEYFIEVEDPEIVELLYDAIDRGMVQDEYGNRYVAEQTTLPGADWLIRRE